MKRVSLTLDEESLRKLDKWVKNFELDFRGNRSGYINSLIQKYTPETPE